MHEVNVSMFYEGEERAYDDFYVMGWFKTHEDAESFARALVFKCRDELELMLKADQNSDGWDGMSVDVRDVSVPCESFDTSYEVIPGKPISVWHAEDKEE